MSADRDEELVRSFFATLSTGDLDLVGAFFDDDSTWTVCGTDIPGAGTHRGRAIVEEFLRPVRGMFAPGQPEVELTNLLAAGGWVAVEATGRGEFLTGTPYENHYAFWLEVDGETIRTIREYMDTHYVALLTP
ncbi:MAG TPA: nuclear transport factor 2 family protein [Candidatus Dormibacteraeota bacterium]|nr:nuclear transport factor 2 family protein [Candidatus Dormibacteraeota bacterium]